MIYVFKKKMWIILVGNEGKVGKSGQVYKN